MNLSNLEKILQNPDTELKAQIQNQMTSEQLKHLIEDKFPMYPNGDLTGMNQMNAQRVVGAKLCLNDPSILRHADPEIMRQAGWVREGEVLNYFRIRIKQLKLREAELHWNIYELGNQSYISKERDRRELDKIMFTHHELQSILSQISRPPNQ